MRDRCFTCTQKVGETIELRNRSKTCDFGELTDSLIKDRIVCGIKRTTAQETGYEPGESSSAVQGRGNCTQAKELINESCAVVAVKKRQTPRSM